MASVVEPVKLSPSGRTLGTVEDFEAVPHWRTLLDVDFTTEPNQTLSPDGTYSVGGYTWTKENSANDVVPTQIVAGSGLVFCPVAGLNNYYQTHTAPLIAITLGDLVTDPTALGASTPLRAMFRGYSPGYAVFADHEVLCALEYCTGGINVIYGSRVYRQWDARGGQCRLRHATATELLVGNSIVTPTYDVACIWLPNGVAGVSVCFGRALWGTEWPEIPFTAAHCPTIEYWNLASWPDVGFGRNWRFALSAESQNQDPTYQWWVTQARVQAFW